MVIARPVRSSRAASKSRRGSQLRARRSILDTLRCRDSERVAASSEGSPPSARSRIAVTRRSKRRAAAPSLTANAIRPYVNAAPIAQMTVIEVSGSSPSPMAQCPNVDRSFVVPAQAGRYCPPARSPRPARGKRMGMEIRLFMADSLLDDLEERPVEAVIFGARQKIRADSIRFEHPAQHAFGRFT